jgi:hypothetical protein
MRLSRIAQRFAQRSDSDQTAYRPANRSAVAVRIAQRSQSIPIPIPKRLTKGKRYLQGSEIGGKTLPPNAAEIETTVRS